MKVNKEERIIVDNWFRKNKEIGNLIGKNEKQVSYIKSQLRKRFQPEQRTYLTEDQISYVISNKNKLSARQISENIGIDMVSIYNLWSRFNKRKSTNPKDYMFKYNRRPWSLDEQLYIEQNIDKKAKEIVKSRVIDRSKEAVIVKKYFIRKNGGMFYNITNDIVKKGSYDQFVLRSADILTAKEASQILNAKVETLRSVARKLNISFKPSVSKWREEEINILKTNVPKSHG
jgi:hypothetical protein